jgi:hypothetical protein
MRWPLHRRQRTQPTNPTPEQDQNAMMRIYGKIRGACSEEKPENLPLVIMALAAYAEVHRSAARRVGRTEVFEAAWAAGMRIADDRLDEPEPGPKRGTGPYK